MTVVCDTLHRWANGLERYTFPYAVDSLPVNGIYLLFERGERGHDSDRIVRVGTHTGDGQLVSRLRQHFLVQNKDRSIFRKNVGRSLLHRDGDSFETDWEIDLTTREAKDRYALTIDGVKMREVEDAVSAYIQTNMSFVAIPVSAKAERLDIESRLISTLSKCEQCRPSSTWLGLSSPKEKIRASGLWLVNELYKAPMTPDQMVELTGLVGD